MEKFAAPDLLLLEDEFSQEERMIRDSVRSFVDEELLPVIGEAFDKGIFPKDLIKPLGEMGTLGASLHGYECAGVSSTAYGLIMRELERGDSGIRSFVSVQGALCMFPIHSYASEELKNKYLPKMAKGELIGCFGLTEADFGSNPSGMRTTVKKDGSDYILNGSKMWITNGTMADLAIVWAKNEEGRIEGFIVDKDLPGFSANDIQKKFSLRASVTSELVFEDCRVPASHKLEVTGLRGPFSCLNEARYGIAWGALGSSMACYDEALRYAKSRIQFDDKPIAGHQLVQAKLVEMYSDITEGQLLALRLGRLKEEGKVIPQMISLAKMNNVSRALKHARLTRDILGASGITYEYQCGRHLLNLESVNTYEGTEDIHRLILGQHITGLPAFQ
ncbi:MAG: acyl-CoA dehydrogenase family protein [Bdellovibrionaceae bacterium]|nr:acyl-CoA dehydrogenase family protein [Pseudobdellovibrionaceae bacterium]